MEIAEGADQHPDHACSQAAEALPLAKSSAPGLEELPLKAVFISNRPGDPGAGRGGRGASWSRKSGEANLVYGWMCR